MEAKIFAETHGEKLKDAELEIWKTQWLMCKAEALVDPLANTPRAVESQTSLETLVELKAKALVLENKEALANKLTHTITECQKNTLAYTLQEEETEVWVVTQVYMLEKQRSRHLQHADRAKH